MNKKEIQSSAKELYDGIKQYRESLEGTWQDASQLTLPYVFPSDSLTESEILPSPFNSVGPSSVNALASKLLVALLPPSGTFFRLLPDLDVIADLNADELTALDKELSKVEQDVVELINQQSLRVPIYEALKLLIITGNVLLYKVPKGSFKVFSPYNYVVQRDYVGNLLYAVIKEKVAYSTIPDKVKKQVMEDSDDITNIEHSNKEEEEIYTAIMREGTDKYKVWQEIDGIIIEGSEKTYTEDKLPYIVLRWSTVNNESYGRGLVEQYLGDFRSLEGLTQTIVEGAGISAKHIFGVKPGATVQVEDLNNAENGDFVLGDLEREVTVLQVNKSADLQVPFSLLQSLENRISKAFLMLSGQIRDSERTTAVEVRATVSELEATLGGIFSVLAAEFQRPLIMLLLNELEPNVLKITVPSITTGIGAISRERDFQNLNTMLQAMAQLGPETLATYLKLDSYLAKVATALGIDPESIVKSNEQIQAERQQQMQMQQAMQQQQTQSQIQVEQAKQQTQ